MPSLDGPVHPCKEALENRSECVELPIRQAIDEALADRCPGGSTVPSVALGDEAEGSRPTLGRTVSPDLMPPGPVTSWTGWDVRGGASAQPDAAETFVQTAPPDSGADTRYELIAVAAPRVRP